jgi:hypothetical protein
MAKEVVQAAEQAVGEVQNMLDTAQERLRVLQRERPLSTTDPHRVTEVVQAQLSHELQVLELQREVEALQKILEGRRADQGALKEDYRQLRERAQQFTSYLPTLQRQTIDARQELATRERDAVRPKGSWQR